MRLHFIAIGGSIMHSLAITLLNEGHHITGSDDEIFDPSRSSLLSAGLLPPTMGWDPANITDEIDAVILGMHAKKDNPELQRAVDLGIPVFSFPEFFASVVKDQTKVVIAGSHGKTTITGMITHILNSVNYKFSNLVGAHIEGLVNQVHIDRNGTIAVIEGDEYKSSPVDQRPKFLHYDPDICLISGIAWDHINVYPTEELYINQFKELLETLNEDRIIIYCEEDPALKGLILKSSTKARLIPYGLPEHKIEDGQTYLVSELLHPLHIFGKHNLLNLSGARAVCRELGINDQVFNRHIESFKGAANRLQLLEECRTSVVYKDFAHAPSKVEATTLAIRNQYPDRKLTACLELHTFSSLHPEFIGRYQGTLNQADLKIVYINPEAMEKKGSQFDITGIKSAFGDSSIFVYFDVNELRDHLYQQSWQDHNLLFMTSGHYGGLNLSEIAKFVCSK